MPRPSRRHEIEAAALAAFVDRGCEATSVADIADTVGVSKAAISYHFPAKDDLLAAVAEPLLAPLERLLEEADGDADVERFLAGYLDVLLAHPERARWLDGDRGVLASPRLGPRLEALQRATRTLLLTASDASEALAISALGALWRPIRQLGDEAEDDRDNLVAAAVATLALG